MMAISITVIIQTTLQGNFTSLRLSTRRNTSTNGLLTITRHLLLFSGNNLLIILHTLRVNNANAVTARIAVPYILESSVRMFCFAFFFVFVFVFFVGFVLFCFVFCYNHYTPNNDGVIVIRGNSRTRGLFLCYKGNCIRW